jgi:hypothetical protein
MTNKNRKASLTISDLETIHAIEQIRLNSINSEKYNEHNEIFEEICQDAEAEDEIMETSLPSSTIMTRRTSITGCTSTTSSTIVLEPFEKDLSCRMDRHHYPRRHSTYNGRNRKFHRDAHATIKDYFLTIQDVNHARRTSFVTNLMDFNLSFDVAMAASNSNGISPTLNLSCPILSYLKEDDEDSIELIMIKRPSLITDKEEFNQSANWESLKDDGESEEDSMDNPNHKTEYVIELAPLEEDYDSSWGKKRNNDRQRRKKKVHSYQMLEQRLSSESLMSVVKSFGLHGMSAAAAIGYPTTTSHTSAAMKFSSSQQRRRSDDNPAKEYAEDEESQNVSSAYPTRNQPISTTQPCARGA